MFSKLMYAGSAAVLVASLVTANLVTAEDAKVASEDGQHFRAKQILGAKVGLEGNTQAGTVDDIVLDESGNVDYLIVMTGENKLVTVPWDATRFNVEKRMVGVQIQQDQFQKIPTYTVEQYPAFATPTYRTQVYKYYGLTPGQQRRAFRRATK